MNVAIVGARHPKESADLDSLVALLTDDVFISMPPLPFEYQGREPASRFYASVFASGRKFEFLRTRANGQPALGAYVRDPTGISHGIGLFVFTLAGDEIRAMTRFENTVLPWFGLPRSIPSRCAEVPEAVPRSHGPARSTGVSTPSRHIS